MASARLVWWGYFVELAAAALSLVALCLVFGQAAVIAFSRNAAIDVATLFCGIFFAAALAFLWTFYSKSDTEFYRWLDKRGAFDVYLRATGYAVAVSASATLALIGVKYIASDPLTLLAAFLLLLAVINLCTLVQNVFGLMRLNTMFNHVQRKDS
jgi:hypothetical protein